MEHILDKEKMESMKVLAETSMKISEAKGVLFKLQETETEYLVSREKKAVARIQQVLNDSQEILDKALNNHAQVKEYTDSIMSGVEFLNETYKKFQGMLANFNERNELWEKNIKQKEEQIAHQRKLVETDEKNIEKAYKDIEEKKREFKKAQEVIESRQQALIQSYKIEKDLWDKLHK